jgi:hypothetical protein
MMRGHFVSENAEMIVFKDQQGIQYSLKKSVLDLEKMKDVNTPPEPPPAPEPVEIQSEEPAEPTQTAPVEPPKEEHALAVEPVAPALSAVAAPDENPYVKSLHAATSKLQTAFETAKSLLDGMMTAWEVNASTGRDPATALQEFKATKAATITALADSQIQTVDKLQESLGNPPSQYVSALQTFNNANSELHQYYDAIRQYDGKPSLRVFKSRLTAKEQSIQNKIETLKALK